MDAVPKGKEKRKSKLIKQWLANVGAMQHLFVPKVYPDRQIHPPLPFFIYIIIIVLR